MPRFGALKSSSNAGVFNAEDYGAVADDFYIDGVATSASTTFTSATASFVAGDAGKTIVIERGGGSSYAPHHTTIASVTNSTTVVLTNAAGRSQSSARFYISRSGDQASAIQSAIDAAYAAGGGTVLLPGVGYLVSGLVLKNRVWLEGAGQRSTLLHMIASNPVYPVIRNDQTVNNSASFTGIVKLMIDGNATRCTHPTTTATHSGGASTATVAVANPTSTWGGVFNASTDHYLYTGGGDTTSLTGVVGGIFDTTDTALSGTSITWLTGVGIQYVTNPTNTNPTLAETFDPGHVIRDVIVRNCKGNCIELIGHSDMVLDNVFTDATQKVGIFSTYDTQFNNCRIRGAGLMGFYTRSGSIQINGMKSYTNGGNDATRGYGYMIESPSQPANGMVQINAYAQDNKAHGFYFKNCDRVQANLTAMCNGWSGTNRAGNGTYPDGTYSGVKFAGVNDSVFTILSTENNSNNGVTTQCNAVEIDTEATSSGSYRNTFIVSHNPSGTVSQADMGPAIKSTSGVNGNNKWIINGGIGDWTTLTQQATQVKTNNTLVDSTNMQFFLRANCKYRVRGKIFFDTTDAGDFKYTFVGPASPTLVRTNIVATVAGGTPAEVAVGTAYPSSSGVALTGTGTTGGIIQYDLIIHNGSNAGNFSFQFAQNTTTADSGAQLLAGSYMEVVQVNMQNP